MVDFSPLLRSSKFVLSILDLIHLFIGFLDSLGDVKILIKDHLRVAAARRDSIRLLGSLVICIESRVNLLDYRVRITLAEYDREDLISAESGGQARLGN